MSCSPFDLKDYLLNELPEAAQREVQGHAKTCASCREEMERLRLTEAALLSLRDEEVPQRIAFVSDKIFEPSPWRRALAGLWGSAARLGFASAAMLSIAIVVFALTRPSPAPRAAVITAPASISPAEVQRQIQQAVDQAVAVTEARLEQKMERQTSDIRQLARLAEVQMDMSKRRELVTLHSTANYGPPRSENGDLK